MKMKIATRQPTMRSICALAIVAGANPRALRTVSAWIAQPSHAGIARQHSAARRAPRIYSTPFEVDFYDDANNPFVQEVSSMAQPPDVELVVGLNKYSHDTAICVANRKTGEVLFAMSKERITRKKHDSGNVASLVEACLDYLDLDNDSIKKVVMNNHHHRILPLEANAGHMEWEAGLSINGGVESGYEDDENLLSGIPKMEMSHHLAHAYSTAAQSPFDRGMVVVMDGMGETYRTMLRGKVTNDATYVSDLDFADGSFQCIPSDIRQRNEIAYFDHREAESVYVYEKKGTTMSLRPVFKRFTPENSSPTLYNHGFENMDSVGALYSRASSHVFGDWNACGKLMGMAPWIVHSWEDQTIVPKKIEGRIMTGKLYSEKEGEQFQKDITFMTGMPHIARMDSDLFDHEGNLIRQRRYDFDDDDDDIDIVAMQNKDGEYKEEEGEKQLPTKVALDAISLGHRIQTDLEDIVMDFVRHFKDETGETNLCIAGGVGLNSVLNGRLSRELGFERTYISPYPGDDGIAVGCCAYALFGNEELDKAKKQAINEINESSGGDDDDDEEDGTAKADDDEAHQVVRPPVWSAPLSPYLGIDYNEAEIKAAIDKAAPWLEVEAIRNEDRRVDMIVDDIAEGAVVAWYTGRSELGPRALGHRSILADPRKKGLVRFINEHVKKRESFRPFAPSVLVEHAAEWFDLGDVHDDANVSPYMSITAMVRESKRERIPAVTHVDGSSRLQTVTPEAEPLYHKLIKKFHKKSGIPLVLNTSFNTLPGEPIVQTPTDAILSFLASMGTIEVLVMGDYVIRRKQADIQSLLGAISKGGDIRVEPLCPKRTGAVSFETSYELEEGETEPDNITSTTKVRMPDRPMHHDKTGWFELVDELEAEILGICDGTLTLNDIIAQYSAVDKDKEVKSEDVEETKVLLQNIVARLVRLHEHTLVSW